MIIGMIRREEAVSQNWYECESASALASLVNNVASRPPHRRGSENSYCANPDPEYLAHKDNGTAFNGHDQTGCIASGERIKSFHTPMG
jgi:hypothetical protein